MTTIRLVPFTEEHLAGFEEMLDDEPVRRFTRVPVPVPPGFPRTWLGNYESGRRQGTSEAFAVMRTRLLASADALTSASRDAA